MNICAGDPNICAGDRGCPSEQRRNRVECAVGQRCACGMHAEYASMSTLNVWSTESVTCPFNESLTDVAQQSSGRELLLYEALSY